MLAPFTGFGPGALDWFRGLEADNSREYFEGTRGVWQAQVRAPLERLLEELAEELGGSVKMFRPHRDVRFSKDKRPYKEHGACQFRHRLGRDVHAPGFYVHLAPKEVFVGAGLWMPEADALLKIRSAIAARPAAWKKIVNDERLVDTFGAVEGEQLLRPPRGFDPNHPLIGDIRRKSFVVGRASTERAARSADFVSETADCFAAAAPFMRFLCSALAVPM